MGCASRGRAVQSYLSAGSNEEGTDVELIWTGKNTWGTICLSHYAKVSVDSKEQGI